MTIFKTLQLDMAAAKIQNNKGWTTKKEDHGIVYSVDHYRQRFNWDCGVSCVLMLLPTEQREQFLDKFDEICAEEGFGHSTWTIDLCYLLKRFGIDHHMYTTMLGVNENYKKQGYYNNIIDMDRGRVQHRFKEASSSHILVSEESITNERLRKHLRTKGPVMVLVDAGLLVCDLCKHNKLKAEFRRCFGGGYKGHYILIVGYSARTNKFFYRDPAVSARLCALSYIQMDRCRAAVGTDDDCILVDRNMGYVSS